MAVISAMFGAMIVLAAGSWASSSALGMALVAVVAFGSVVAFSKVQGGGEVGALLDCDVLLWASCSWVVLPFACVGRSSVFRVISQARDLMQMSFG